MLGEKNSSASEDEIRTLLRGRVGVGVVGSAQGLVLARQNWRPMTILFSFYLLN